jgi:hypothetical protein
VAFLDALTVGFGLQRLVPFIVVWIMALFWGFVAKRNGLGAAIVSSMLWALVVVILLMTLPAAPLAS